MIVAFLFKLSEYKILKEIESKKFGDFLEEKKTSKEIHEYKELSGAQVTIGTFIYKFK